MGVGFSAGSKPAMKVLSLLALAYATLAQDYQDAINFLCPESNGFFPDPEQCDKYYECVDNIPEEKFCTDGLLFNDTNPNQERCDYPFNVECGKREFVQEPAEGLDPRCYRSFGYFNHEDENICNKYYNCVHGFPHEYECPSPLIFDEAQGTCSHEVDASQYARRCEKNTTKPEIEGFSCPDEETLGPNGQPLAHPSFRHPSSCRKYLTCYFSTDLKELGCMDGQVFNHKTSICVSPEEGPEDCKCWYKSDCPSNCVNGCYANCECS